MGNVFDLSDSFHIQQDTTFFHNTYITRQYGRLRNLHQPPVQLLWRQLQLQQAHEGRLLYLLEPQLQLLNMYCWMVSSDTSGRRSINTSLNGKFCDRIDTLGKQRHILLGLSYRASAEGMLRCIECIIVPKK